MISFIFDLFESLQSAVLKTEMQLIHTYKFAQILSNEVQQYNLALT
jgi:hypothetical protein